MSNIKTLGVMLDCSRNAVMKPEKVKEYAKNISEIGYSMMQLYTEDTYTIDTEPYFGYMRGRFTKEELKDISSYCESVGVELIPCIQTLAHVNQITRWDDYQGFIDCFDILLAGDERTYALIEKMFVTLEECFVSRQVNIGMDEAHFIGLGKYLNQHGFQDRREILINHLKKVDEIASKHGFKIMMWSDMFFRLCNGGSYFTDNCENLKDVSFGVPENVSLVYWDYYSKSKEHYDKAFEAHNKIKDGTIFGGGAWTWTGFTPNLSFSLDASRQAIMSAEEHNIETFFLTMWGDNGKECSYFTTLPVLFAVSQFAKGNFIMDDIKSKFKNWCGYEFDDFMKLELPNYTGQIESDVNNPSKYLLYNDPFLRLMDCTVIDTMPQMFTDSAKELKNMVDDRKYSYLFESAYRLTKLLAVKCDLGVKTEIAYKNGDKKEIKRIAEEDYENAIKRTEKFFTSFKKLWMTENKSFGFEVQEARIGGLIFRLRNCQQELIDYSNGNLSVIEELEETALPIHNNLVGKQMNYNSYSTNVSTSVM